MCMGREGVRRARVSLMAQKADIDYQPDVISADVIVQHIIEFGFGASLLESGIHNQHSSVDLQVRHFHTPRYSCAVHILAIFERKAFM